MQTDFYNDIKAILYETKYGWIYDAHYVLCSVYKETYFMTVGIIAFLMMHYVRKYDVLCIISPII